MSKKRGFEGDTAADEDMRKLAVKHASLKQDYNELQRETRALKKRVQRAKLKKDNLMAEVRFLRRRYRHLTRQPSEVQVNVAPFHNPSAAVLSVRGAERNNVINPIQSLLAQPMAAKYKNATMYTSFEEEAACLASRNQPYGSATSPHPYENPPVAREFQVFWEPLRTSDRQEAPSHHETPKRKSVLENGGLVADLNLSIFKDIPNVFVLPNRVGKPKVSWQDQMALKV
ncbi:uncharacterized protein LOC131060661 isoform X2 [Cryptomeria japonica]|uniref:uncharacterized protein LOC131060661 isoform X2 n=1 Tax=Cryptomeria japonica TaxID=3369 RepID=UPI0025AC2F5B|nr:uncharacterized protein LOC131060661 isoform X2 [Cryptomeria japonica]